MFLVSFVIQPDIEVSIKDRNNAVQLLNKINYNMLLETMYLSQQLILPITFHYIFSKFHELKQMLPNFARNDIDLALTTITPAILIFFISKFFINLHTAVGQLVSFISLLYYSCIFSISTNIGKIARKKISRIFFEKRSGIKVVELEYALSYKRFAMPFLLSTFIHSLCTLKSLILSTFFNIDEEKVHLIQNIAVLITNIITISSIFKNFQ
uniref:Golgi apparatus membrane protein TVP23 homolog n=1 Tax=Parastrongyloides trichosuri TaxID=131310 RepID=A0A0N5A2B2_PARTI